MGRFPRTAALLGIVFLLIAQAAFAQDDDEEMPEGDGEYGEEMPSDELEDPGDMDEAEAMGEAGGGPMTQDQSRKIHELVDANKDGKINVAELMKFHNKFNHDRGLEDDIRMGDFDKNQDEKVSEEEFIALDGGIEDADGQAVPLDEIEDVKGLREVESAKFKAADANSDGYLSKDELFIAHNYHLHHDIEEAVAKVVLKQKDKDGDGFLTVRELFGASSEDDPSADEFAETEFKKLDTNGDGKLGLNELAPYESGRYHTEFSMKGIIRSLDSDGDGHASTHEMLEHYEKLAEEEVGEGHFHLEQWIDHLEL
jgi:Ca2+-binding EF-hand superfamily protein